MKTAPTKILRDNSEPLRHWLILPSELRKWGQALLHQQCWCWGQDIRRAEGDLLIEHGFSRTRPPANYKGSPTYHKRLDNSRAVTLWGFGMCYSQCDTGSLFLSRRGFSPRFTPLFELSRQAWKIEHLEDFYSPRIREECLASLHLLHTALQWLRDYEQQILAENGLAYRQNSLKAWPHTVIAPNEMPAEWQRLSTLCQKHSLICNRDASGVHRTPAQLDPAFIYRLFQESDWALPASTCT